MDTTDQGWTAPNESEIGHTSPTVWVMPGDEDIDGWYLGFFSSQRDDHTHAGERPIRGRGCQACRWFEMSLWRTTDGAYVLVRQNVTRVPSERDFTHLHRVEAAADLLGVADMGVRSRPMRALLEAAAPHDEAVAQVAWATRWDTPTWETVR
jgi:hypothetical protein